MLQYILECIAFQLMFLIIYDVFLKRETFFQWNRVYLIGTYLISMIIPWIKIEAMKTTVPESFQAYPEFLWNMNSAAIVATAPAETTFTIAWEYALLFGGMFLAALFFGYKLFQIYALKQKGEVQYFKDFTKIIVANSAIAFSFFRSIFLGDKVIQKEHQNILQHELVHIRQRHSYDLIFFELMRIIGWFNPLVYVYQSRVSELHEFIADAQVAKTHKKEQYQLLLSEVFQTQHISFINQFFKSSLIKKRIVMLSKAKSKRIFQLKYLLLLPLVFGMLAYTSSETLNDDRIHELEQNDDDEKLIADTQREIENEITQLGTLGSVFFTFSQSNFEKGEAHIFSKKEYFKEQMLYKMFFEEMKPVEFGDDVQPREPLPQMTLPSTRRYENYVSRKEAFLILDQNLQFSIKAYDQHVGRVETKSSYPDTSFLFEVADVKDLTGKELGAFNIKLAEIFEQGGTVYSDIILTDGSYAFSVYQGFTKKRQSFYESSKAEVSKDKFPSGKGMTKVSSTIAVENLDQLTAEEENQIFQILIINNNGNYDWELAIKDANSSMKFIRSNNGSYLSGPNGEKIAATLVYDSTLSENSKWSITEFLKKNGTNNLEARKTRLLKGDPVPFAKVDEVPIFPGCENAENKRACFQKSMQRHIAKNFKYPKEAQEKGIQGRVNVMFVISKKGKIEGLRMRGPDSLLEKEVARIIGRLPKMKPGKHKAKKVDVPFSIPVVFKLKGNEKTEHESVFKEKVASFTGQYNKLVAERERLLKSTNEKNPIIINLDEQLKSLKESLTASLKNKVNDLENSVGVQSNVDLPDASLTNQYNKLVAERKRLIQSSNEKNPIIVNLDNQIKALEKSFTNTLKYQIIPENNYLDKSVINTVCQYNKLVAERRRLLQGSNEKNPIIVALDEQLDAMKKSLHNQLPLNKIKTAPIENDNDVDVPFAVVENVPVFPSCENETDKRACFNKMMQEHIAKNFRYPKEAQEKGIQGRVSIMFTVDKKGKVTNIRKRGPDTLLEQEAERIMKLLPLMKPGKQRGKPVNVPFAIPITFKLQGTPYKFQDIQLSNETGSEPIFTNDGNGLNYRKTYALEPMFLIDGKESSKDAVGIINPDDIESMSVLKGEAAKSAYGEKAKNGVIVITTKKKE